MSRILDAAALDEAILPWDYLWQVPQNRFPYARICQIEASWLRLYAQKLPLKGLLSCDNSPK